MAAKLEVAEDRRVRRCGRGRPVRCDVPSVRLRAIWQIGAGVVVRGEVQVGWERGQLVVDLVPAATGRRARGEG